MKLTNLSSLDLFFSLTFFFLVFSLDQSSNQAFVAKAYHRGGSLSLCLIPHQSSTPIGMNNICWFSVCRFRSWWGGFVIIGFGFVSSNRYEVVVYLLGLGLQGSDWLWLVWGVGFGFMRKVVIGSVWGGGDFAQIGANRNWVLLELLGSYRNCEEGFAGVEFCWSFTKVGWK